MTQHFDMPESCQLAICTLLDALDAKNCLLLGREDDELISVCNRDSVEIESYKQIDARTLSQCGQFDFVLLVDVLEQHAKQEVERCLASLRDLLGGCFAVIYRPALVQNWQSQDLLALGMHRINLDEAGVELYVFDIHNYKETPDWLNSKNWAHPELFDKYRW